MATQPEWTLFIVDSAGTGLGVVPYAYELNITYQLNNPDMAQFKVPVTSSIADSIEPGSTYLKAYRRGVGETTSTLRFYGPVWIVEESGTNSGVDMVTVTAMGIHNYLTKRFTTAQYTSFTDQGTIIKGIIDTTNSTDGETGIRTSVVSTTVGITRKVDYSDAKLPISEVISQFGDASDGCDTWITPIELSSGKMGDLNCAAVRGEFQAGAIFGYGEKTTANCTTMSRVRTMELVANDVTGYSDNLATQWIDTSSVANYRRLMADVSFTETITSEILDYRTRGYLDLHVTPDAVAEVSMIGGPRAPKLFTDFDIGDFVPVYYQKADIVFYSVNRVYGATIAINEGGVEQFASLETRTI